eukprot:TRINITY_DN27410_c0_g1_i1.p1 TRINITY_DN27410_c0_g1~~TRINITY_DN27410_c0_g1_i1.p1  ORF type:complete len:508 (+),score=89.65 TRINITY_DN27410_c0_g1_i1:61-1524(+)
MMVIGRWAFSGEVIGKVPLKLGDTTSEFLQALADSHCSSGSPPTFASATPSPSASAKPVVAGPPSSLATKAAGATLQPSTSPQRRPTQLRHATCVFKGRIIAVNEAMDGAGVHDGGVVDLVCSRFARCLTYSESSVKVWDSEMGSCLLHLEGPTDDTLLAAASSPDASCVATGHASGLVRLWSSERSEVAHVCEGHRGEVKSVAFSADGRCLVTSSADNTARTWDASTGNLVVTLTGHDDAVSCAAFSPCGRLVVTGSDDASASVWDAATGEELAILDGSAAVVDSAVVGTAHERSLCNEGLSEPITSVALSCDGLAILTTADDGIARLWCSRSGVCTREITLGGRHISRATFSDDGCSVVTSHDDGTAAIWCRETGDEKLTVTASSDPLHAAVLSPDGRLLLTAPVWSPLSLYDANTGLLLHQLENDEDGSSSQCCWAAFSPCGRLVASASSDGRARLWRVDTGKRELTLEAHDEPVCGISFLGDR